jgi:hypothetical protein
MNDPFASPAGYKAHKTVEMSPKIQPKALKPIDDLSVLPE